MRVWSSTDGSKVAVSTFSCKDTTVATLEGAFPASGFARADTLVSVFITNSGYAARDTVFLTQGGATTAMANAAIGGSPMEVVLTLTSTTPGDSSITLVPCADPGSDGDCQKKAVAFAFSFLDPDAVRVTGFFPMSEYVSGRTSIDVQVYSPESSKLKTKPLILNPQL